MNWEFGIIYEASHSFPACGYTSIWGLLWFPVIITAAAEHANLGPVFIKQERMEFAGPTAGLPSPLRICGWEEL